MTTTASKMQIPTSIGDIAKRIFLGKPLITDDLQTRNCPIRLRWARFRRMRSRRPLRPRADPDRVAALCGDGRVRAAVAAPASDPADPVGGDRVVPAGGDGLHPGRRILHRRRDNFGPRVAQVAAAALLIDYVVTVAMQSRRHSRGGLGDSPLGTLQPGDHVGVVLGSSLRQPARVAGGRARSRCRPTLHRHVTLMIVIGSLGSDSGSADLRSAAHDDVVPIQHGNGLVMGATILVICGPLPMVVRRLPGSRRFPTRSMCS